MKQIYKLILFVHLTPLLWIVAGSEVYSQNLVPNWSFEDTIPINLASPIVGPEAVPPWFSGLNDSSPDYFSSTYFNNLSWGYKISVPANFLGYQNAKSGAAYIGLGNYFYPTVLVREYVTCPIQPLISNHNYLVNFYISLSNNSMYAINGIGAYFSVDTPNLLIGQNYVAQINYNSNLTYFDTLNWMNVSGYYTASGGEKYISLGNFNSLNNLNTTIVNSTGINHAYYYIDDVSVIDCTATAINENELENLISLFPNPSSKKIKITTQQNCFIEEVEIYNALGEKLLQQKIPKQLFSVDVNIGTLPKDIYIVKIKTNKGIVYKKLIKQ